MFLKRSREPEPVLFSAPPAPDPSMRRQGAVETLNLIARSVADAVSTARQQAEADKPDNFLAGQLMAFGQVVSSIESERDLLRQQLIHEAGLHAAAEAAEWDDEMKLLVDLPVTSEELFRLAMDYRQVEDPVVDDEETGSPDEVVELPAEASSEVSSADSQQPSSEPVAAG